MTTPRANEGNMNNNIKKNNDLHPGYHLFRNDQGRSVVRILKTRDEATEKLKDLLLNNRYIYTDIRPHGGYRQTLHSKFQMQSEESDKIKAGGDRLKKYQHILVEAGWEPINWETVSVEVVVLEMLKKDPAGTGDMLYAGISVFTENTDAGREFLDRIASGAPRKNDVQEEEQFKNEPVLSEL